MIIKARIKVHGVETDCHYDLSRVVSIRADDDGLWVLFYGPDTPSTPFGPRPLATSVPMAYIQPYINEDDWLAVQQVYDNLDEPLLSYIRIADIHSYIDYPADDEWPTPTLGLIGRFGIMKVTNEVLPTIKAEFTRRRAS